MFLCFSGLVVTQINATMSGGLDVLTLNEEDVTKMLAATTHLGAENVNFQVSACMPFLLTRILYYYLYLIVMRRESVPSLTEHNVEYILPTDVFKQIEIYNKSSTSMYKITEMITDGNLCVQASC